MNRSFACLAAFGFTVVSLGSTLFASECPNIVMLLADDMGYRDLSCFDSPAVQTPNIDRLAAEGMKWTHFYSASAVCTPTRASVLTGRYPLRFNITKHFNDVSRSLPVAATTIAELLGDAGYSTGHVGKWHLGGLHVDDAGVRMTDQPGPGQHGFDFYQTQIEQQPIRGKMGRERTLFRKGGTVLLRNGRRISENDSYYAKHFTDANGDYAVELIEQFTERGKPFFLNVWWLVPHKPYEPASAPHWDKTAAEGITDDQHRFRSMVEHMDAKVGQILTALERLGIADNTVVLFTSDNGGAFESNIGQLKGGKTDLHEGGIRVPMIVRWPGQIEAGSTTDTFGHSNDLLPTFCAAANVAVTKSLPLDGQSLLPHMRGGAALAWEERDTVFWQLDLYRGLQRHYKKPKPYATEIVRRGNWKLLAFKGKPVELFDVDADPFERTNVMSKQPELVQSMAAALKEWLAEDRVLPE